MSNDGYFGQTAAREQHLALVRMRAAENARWILRATNDGITAAVDPAGRVTQRLEPNKELASRLMFDFATGAQTMYTRYGDWLPWTCVVLAMVALVVTQIPRYG
jgi:apolipoprotein N-acyltransferase